METKEKTKITIAATVNASVDTVWKKWTNPTDIMKWNNASDDWHTPHAENDVRVGGKFLSTMAAKDGSVSFDFVGTYTNVKVNELIEYTMGDSRTASIIFTNEGTHTKIVITFEAEEENSIELQQGGWQAILNNFKKHVESNS